MKDRFEFRIDTWHALNVGIGWIVVGAALFFWYWLEPVIARWDGSPKGQMWKLACGLMASGFGLWELARLGSRAVKVTVDRDGITDVRVSDRLIPWSEVERIDRLSFRQSSRYWRVSGLRLALRADPQAQVRHPGPREVLIWDRGLTGGPQALRQAIALMAPQVPQGWNTGGGA